MEAPPKNKFFRKKLRLYSKTNGESRPLKGREHWLVLLLNRCGLNERIPLALDREGAGLRRMASLVDKELDMR